jgi:hypothetical protein
VLALTLSGLALLLAAPAYGIQEQGFTMDDSHPHVHLSYPPIAGNDAQTGNVFTPSIENCTTFPGDVLIPISISFKRQIGTLDTFTVGWTGVENDIDTYILDSKDNEVGAGTDSATDRPEVIRLGNLTNGTYYLCVVSFSGQNTGFTVDARREFLTLYKYTPPAETPAPTPGTGAPSTSAPAPSATAAPGGAAVSAPTAEPVVTPGSNGPTADQQLFALSPGRQASATTKRSIVGFVFAVVLVLIAVAGVVFVAVRIRRDTA